MSTSLLPFCLMLATHGLADCAARVFVVHNCTCLVTVGQQAVFKVGCIGTTKAKAGGLTNLKNPLISPRITQVDYLTFVAWFQKPVNNRFSFDDTPAHHIA